MIIAHKDKCNLFIEIKSYVLRKIYINNKVFMETPVIIHINMCLGLIAMIILYSLSNIIEYL